MGLNPGRLLKSFLLQCITFTVHTYIFSDLSLMCGRSQGERENFLLSDLSPGFRVQGLDAASLQVFVIIIGRSLSYYSTINKLTNGSNVCPMLLC